MLNDLKKYINRSEEFTSALEAAAEVVVSENDDIAELFLNDPDARMIGIENDPEIKKLIDAIPPVEGDISDMDIEKMVEEYIPIDEAVSTDDDDELDLEDIDDELEADIEDVFYDGEFVVEASEDEDEEIPVEEEEDEPAEENSIDHDDEFDDIFEGVEDFDDIEEADIEDKYYDGEFIIETSEENEDEPAEENSVDFEDDFDMDFDI